MVDHNTYFPAYQSEPSEFLDHFNCLMRPCNVHSQCQDRQARYVIRNEMLLNVDGSNLETRNSQRRRETKDKRLECCLTGNCTSKERQWFSHRTERSCSLARDMKNCVVEGARGRDRPKIVWLPDIAEWSWTCRVVLDVHCRVVLDRHCRVVMCRHYIVVLDIHCSLVLDRHCIVVLCRDIAEWSWTDIAEWSWTDIAEWSWTDISEWSWTDIAEWSWTDIAEWSWTYIAEWSWTYIAERSCADTALCSWTYIAEWSWTDIAQSGPG